METTFSMTRVQHIMRRDLIENWKNNLYGRTLDGRRLS